MGRACHVAATTTTAAGPRRAPRAERPMVSAPPLPPRASRRRPAARGRRRPPSGEREGGPILPCHDSAAGIPARSGLSRQSPLPRAGCAAGPRRVAYGGTMGGIGRSASRRVRYGRGGAFRPRYPPRPARICAESDTRPRRLRYVAPPDRRRFRYAPAQSSMRPRAESDTRSRRKPLPDLRNLPPHITC